MKRGKKMKNVLITAGGTTEYIDTVRKITNSGSGKLGAIVADMLRNVHIYYVHSKGAILPSKRDNIEFFEVVSTEDVKNTMKDLLTNFHIDWVIHSMAISDYTVDYVTNANMLAEYLTKYGCKEENIIKNRNIFDRNEKISSSEPNIIIKLKPTAKIISLIKDWSPETHLIGFKLLSGVSEEELIEVATNLKIKNKCDYVIANDLNNINSNTHKAIVIGENINRVNTKEEIAEVISRIIV